MAKILSCIKIGCIATGSTAAVVAGGITFDTLIEKTGIAAQVQYLFHLWLVTTLLGVNLLFGCEATCSYIRYKVTRSF